MDISKIKYLILKEEEDIIQFEKGLYNAFIIKTNSNWIKYNYEIINNCRLKPKRPYSEIVIYGIKNEGKIIGACSYNLNIGNSDIEKMGFNIKKLKLNYACESLNLFIDEVVNGEEYQKSAKKFFNYIHSDLADRNFERAYITCQENLELYHKAFGFTKIDSIILNGTKEILMVMDLSDYYL